MTVCRPGERRKRTGEWRHSRMPVRHSSDSRTPGHRNSTPRPGAGLDRTTMVPWEAGRRAAAPLRSCAVPSGQWRPRWEPAWPYSSRSGWAVSRCWARPHKGSRKPAPGSYSRRSKPRPGSGKPAPGSCSRTPAAPAGKRIVRLRTSTIHKPRPAAHRRRGGQARRPGRHARSVVSCAGLVRDRLQAVWSWLRAYRIVPASGCGRCSPIVGERPI